MLVFFDLVQIHYLYCTVSVFEAHNLMKWIIDYALNRCVISIYAWLMLGFTQPYKASRVKPLLVLEITTTAHIAISLCFNSRTMNPYRGWTATDWMRNRNRSGLVWINHSCGIPPWAKCRRSVARDRGCWQADMLGKRVVCELWHTRSIVPNRHSRFLSGPCVVGTVPASSVFFSKSPNYRACPADLDGGSRG